MAIVVTNQNRQQYRPELQQMYRQRYHVFVEQLQWDLPHANDGLECDEFDTEDTVYLLLLDRQGNIQGSSRLLPTLNPHLMSEIFSHLVEGEIPRGSHIWESSRSYILPDRRAKGVLGELFLAMLEIGLLLEIQKITFVCDMNFLSRILHAGWEVDPLGMPEANAMGDIISASSVNINFSTLHNLRRHYNVFESVLDDMPINIAARLRAAKQRESGFDHNHHAGDITCLQGTTWVSHPDTHNTLLCDGPNLETMMNEECQNKRQNHLKNDGNR